MLANVSDMKLAGTAGVDRTANKMCVTRQHYGLKRVYGWLDLTVKNVNNAAWNHFLFLWTFSRSNGTLS